MPGVEELSRGQDEEEEGHCDQHASQRARVHAAPLGQEHHAAHFSDQRSTDEKIQPCDESCEQRDAGHEPVDGIQHREREEIEARVSAKDGLDQAARDLVEKEQPPLPEGQPPGDAQGNRHDRRPPPEQHRALTQRQQQERQQNRCDRARRRAHDQPREHRGPEAARLAHCLEPEHLAPEVQQREEPGHSDTDEDPRPDHTPALPPKAQHHHEGPAS